MGKAVLVTRPAHEAAATAARLRAMDFQPIIAPLLRIEPRRLRLAAPPHAVLVTSGNALPALEEFMQTPLLAVGDATAERARAAGFLRVKSAGGDAADLLDLVRTACPPRARLLLATGAGQGGALAAGLRAARFRVHRRVAYAAIPAATLPIAARAALCDGSLAAAMFLSAETARIFARLLPRDLYPLLTGIDALAIGQPAADALTLLPWRRVRVSLHPTLDQVLALL